MEEMFRISSPTILSLSSAIFEGLGKQLISFLAGYAHMGVAPIWV